MYEFIYCFVIDGRINWSAETVNSLDRWLENEDRHPVNEFIHKSNQGDFITLKSGALVFRCAPTPIEINPRQPRKLGDVLDDAGLLDGESSLNIFEE
ncbi:MAG: hypothetical protein N5P05_004174 (plasmid) [Chroococcopsis gigantea SAG 12.99]|jgi:hypothetical protein|nr:hypothetical protein [Chroococcopsis gigantea SAG 12.99]